MYVWDVQDGWRIRQVVLASVPQGPISCLNWIGEDIEATAVDTKVNIVKFGRVHGIGIGCRI